ncbi:MAG TPA: penicillin acylase family protein [Streptosporangiaceae bacterium]|nr:penicillin acylase family protein [Streptosporangiaceae bacterium]
MNAGSRRRSVAAPGETPRGARAARWRARTARPWVAIVAAAASLTAFGQASAGYAAGRPAAGGQGYRAAIVRTSYGIPHITARGFGSLGYGYGFAFASDDLCTMADDYVTVEAQRSRYFGPAGTYSTLTTPVSNLASDVFWKSVIDRNVIAKLLAVRTGPGAIGPRLRQLIRGYVAGYNGYLASVKGSKGVPDPVCRGKAWVKPITTLDAYLRIYQLIELFGQGNDIDGISGAQPPASGAPAGRPASGPAASGPEIASQATDLGLFTGAASAGAASAGPQPAAGVPAGIGSNAIAVGSAGTRDHRHGLLLGNPHFLWAGPERFYQVQLTIPGVLNVEGATFDGVPLVIVGFTATMAWSLTTPTAFSYTLYQLTLVPGHPTEYIFDGRPTPMTSQTVTIESQTPAGKPTTFRRTLWFSRYGPVIDAFPHVPLPWTTTTAYALADANAGNFRFLNHFLATDEAHSVAAELSILKRYQGVPWVQTIAADSTGHALYADIQAIPDVTNAELARCGSKLGMILFSHGGPPVLDGARPSCAWGTDKDSAAPGIFGPAEEPLLVRRDFVENSNDSYWMTNPARPLTGFPAIIGDNGTGISGSFGADLGLRTRGALVMVMRRIAGTDGLGAPGFTFGDMKKLMLADIQYGATLVRRQLVAMCRAFPHGRAPAGPGQTIAVGDSCRVLARWDGRENPASAGAVLFRVFWENALSLPRGPWSHPFSAGRPVSTPYGLDVASTQVQRAFGAALAAMRAAHLPYDVTLGSVQYVVLAGRKIPLPGGPGDPDGELNAIYQFGGPGSVPLYGSSYIQVVTWKTGDPCPEAATLLTYSESDNPASPHFADQTELFSGRQWAAADFCRDQAAAHAVSVTVVRGR